MARNVESHIHGSAQPVSLSRTLQGMQTVVLAEQGSGVLRLHSLRLWSPRTVAVPSIETRWQSICFVFYSSLKTGGVSTTHKFQHGSIVKPLTR